MIGFEIFKVKSCYQNTWKKLVMIPISMENGTWVIVMSVSDQIIVDSIHLMARVITTKFELFWNSKIFARIPSLGIKFETDHFAVTTLLIEFSDLVVIIQHISQPYPILMTIGRQLENFSIRSIEITMPTQLMILLPSEFSYGFES